MSEVTEIFEQSEFKPQIDEENGVLSHVHILGKLSTHGHSYSDDAINASKSRFEELVVGLNHDYTSSPIKIQDTWGTLRNISTDKDGVWGDLHYLKSHSLTPQVIEDAKKGTNLFALSMAGVNVVKEGKVIKSFIPARVDLVTKSATTKNLFEQHDSDSSVVLMTKIDELMKSLTASQLVWEQKFEEQNKIIMEQRDELKKMSLATKYFESPKTFEQRVENVVKNVDLKKFWSDNKS
jgi:hypothetical protein